MNTTYTFTISANNASGTSSSVSSSPLFMPEPTTYQLALNGFPSYQNYTQYINGESFTITVPSQANQMYLNKLYLYVGNSGYNPYGAQYSYTFGHTIYIVINGITKSAYRNAPAALTTLTTSTFVQCTDGSGSFQTPFSDLGKILLSTGDSIIVYIVPAGQNAYVNVGVNQNQLVSYAVEFGNY